MISARDSSSGARGLGAFSSPNPAESQALNGGYSRGMEQHFPFKQCEWCGRRTSWCVWAGRNPADGKFAGQWHRKCPACMDALEKLQCLDLQSRPFRQKVIYKYGSRPR